MTELIRTSFHCPADLLARLKEIAEQEDRPVAWLLRNMIEDYLEQHNESGGVNPTGALCAPSSPR